MKCKETIKFGDDFGDNVCTMYCGLEEGHLGEHKESGQMQGKQYVVCWENLESKKGV